MGARTKPFSLRNQRPLYSLDAVADDNGICQLMVEPQNYDCEEHTVTTQDGYILSLQRITVGRSAGTTGDRPPVMLQHGVFVDGITWLLLPADKSPAFLLADNNFDVWIANTRGTKYSRGHTSLCPNDAAYWDWTWDTLVSSDLPAVFNYVYDRTGHRLHYVGRSQGTLMALAAFSKEQLLDMLRSAVLLSPIAYVGQMTSPLARSAAENFLAEVNTPFSVGQNMEHYGQATPPLYNMSSIPNDLPLFLSYGGANALSDVRDVKLLLDSFEDHDGDKLVIQYREDYAHTDFVMGKNAKEVVYDPLMAFLRLQ
ncbi:hypothetical protein NL676_017670 [Syzygium grande]|nr:hypothetical protein NL676_017670 [Syzygium grande]